MKEYIIKFRGQYEGSTADYTYDTYTRSLTVDNTTLKLPTLKSDDDQFSWNLSNLTSMLTNLGIKFNANGSRETLAKVLESTIKKISHSGHNYNNMQIPPELTDLIPDEMIQKVDVKLTPKTYEFTITTQPGGTFTREDLTDRFNRLS